jgi:hypothetical protein
MGVTRSELVSLVYRLSRVKMADEIAKFAKWCVAIFFPSFNFIAVLLLLFHPCIRNKQS